METMELYATPLAELSRGGTHQQKLASVHRALRLRCNGIDRIAVALYDQKTRVLKTFVASPASESPLKNYEVVLEGNSSLVAVADSRQSRVIHDLSFLRHGQQFHTQMICGHGFASSYTYPMFLHDELAGFIFFDSVHKKYFRDHVREQVEIFAHLIAGMIMNDLVAMQSLAAALHTAIGMVHMRDPETGNHLERMARYSRLIARELAQSGRQELDDEQIEQIFRFAPLHDVGKIGIPDHILLKPGRLSDEERDVMNSHTVLGRRLVDDLIANFGFDHLPYIDYLRNIVEQHHEAIDGTGYPYGLVNDEIALEAKIVAVSDVFDALTSYRSYKKPWSNEQAFSMMQLMAIDKLEQECVSTLIACRDGAREIQQQFRDPEI